MPPRHAPNVLTFFAALVFLASLVLASCSAIADVEDYDEAEGAGDGDGDGDTGDGDTGDGDTGDGDTGDGDGDGDTGDGDGDGDGDGGAEDVALDCTNPATFCVSLTGFGVHTAEKVEIELLTAGHILRAKAILNPMSSKSADVDAVAVMPLAIPTRELPGPEDEEHALHVEITADDDDDGIVDVPGDHNWDRPLDLDGNLTFPHVTEFDDLERGVGPGADFTFVVAEAAEYAGSLVEVMLIEATSGRAVGLYRVPALETETVEMIIPDIVDAGQFDYIVEVYVDTSGNGRYDGMGVDDSWTFQRRSDDDGVQITFDASARQAPQSELTYQFGFPD